MLRVLLIFALIGCSTGLYFHIAETERKCFIEEIPDETMVIGNYKVQLYDPNTKGYGDYPNIGMHVEVKDPEEKVILSKLYTNSLMVMLRVLLIFALIGCSTGLYFHIAETERKCFIEEIPDETMVIGNYKVQLYDPNTKGYGDYPNIGMHVEVKDPEE
uniref:GOLD domain-containing protein n=1 Tax=Panagrolaimus sp. ES5 TaxID=591445 RepID=A0AC34G5I1_9BILA